MCAGTKRKPGGGGRVSVMAEEEDEARAHKTASPSLLLSRLNDVKVLHLRFTKRD